MSLYALRHFWQKSTKNDKLEDLKDATLHLDNVLGLLLDRLELTVVDGLRLESKEKK